MLAILKARFLQKHRTMAYPKGDPPLLPEKYPGRPVIRESGCRKDCEACSSACPTNAISIGKSGIEALDMGRCLFCRACEEACPEDVISFRGDHRLAAVCRNDLMVRPGDPEEAPMKSIDAGAPFRRSLKLRQVSAGGCGACEADSNVLSTPAWDMGRFGIEFTASPRHADGVLVTGPVTRNMREALIRTLEAVPEPKIVIAVGACAISGGLFREHEEQLSGASSLLEVDVFVPGCPPHPLTILDGLLRIQGRL